MAFIYVIDGIGKIDDQAIGNGTLVLFNIGEQISVAAVNKSLRFLLLTGKPLKEPVAWGGPIVMNTQEEVDAAFREYRAGTFIRTPIEGG